MRKRTLAREQALKILYQAEITRRDIPLAAQIYWSETPQSNDTVKEYSDSLCSGVAKAIGHVDEKISLYATNWQLRRMAVIDRNILRIGVYELIYSTDVPPKVTINEAVELARRYGGEKSPAFVNGVLRTVAEKVRGAGAAPRSTVNDPPNPDSQENL